RLSFSTDPAPTTLYPLSLHDALPIFDVGLGNIDVDAQRPLEVFDRLGQLAFLGERDPQGREREGFVVLELQAFLEMLDRPGRRRSEEHTSELQSRGHLVCRLLLEKKR